MTLPFGKHKGQDLPAIPTDYLRWCLSACKLSSGLRQAVAGELHRRGVEAPGPPPRPAPQCGRCPGAGYLALWQEDRVGGRRIRAECGQCRRYLEFLPQVEPYLSQADAAASEAPILDALTRLEEAGVDLASDGHAVWLRGDDWRKVEPDVMALVRQQSHLLAGLVGDNRHDGIGQADVTAPPAPAAHQDPEEQPR